MNLNSLTPRQRSTRLHQMKRHPKVHIDSEGRSRLRPGLLRCSCKGGVDITGDVNTCIYCGASYSFFGVRLDPA